MIIYKYKLKQDPYSHQDIELPYNAMPLYCGEQHGELYVWCMIPANHMHAQIKPRRFYVLATGHEALHMEIGDMEYLKYINTVQMDNGLVWHVFTRV